MGLRARRRLRRVLIAAFGFAAASNLYHFLVAACRYMSARAVAASFTDADLASAISEALAG